ncbi:exo-alpha-sialidase [Blastococcus sp. TF02-8]|uniref:F510_1955 family glycosylhydrolase n=1 Tax=Blastococcus sp. TF02-8 TaxID=2250574 RepID=UPI000DEA9044|nr:exo-alpha-sialidase [Blastococcus sp. TF02-8]RBY97530.1 exo-alpha-sialidase [Blastococcus sp. TF02-8]
MSVRGVSSAAVLALLLAGCGSQAEVAAPSATVPSGSLPAAHIHGVAVDPQDGARLLATHDGLFRIGSDGASTRVGPVIDLMGFAVAGPGHFLASGHPGAEVDLPQPVGLIESTDGGQTWEALSRQGTSDFHALTTSESGVLAYDGGLMRSTDGQTWEPLEIPAPPATLAASPDGSQVLATTPQGLLRSTDAGTSWSPVEGAPLLQVVDWTDRGSDVVGVDPAGQVWRSADSGATWEQGMALDSAPQAVSVTATDEGGQVLVVTTAALLESRDGGRTFDVVLEH